MIHSEIGPKFKCGYAIFAFIVLGYIMMLGYREWVKLHQRPSSGLQPCLFEKVDRLIANERHLIVDALIADTGLLHLEDDYCPIGGNISFSLVDKVHSPKIIAWISYEDHLEFRDWRELAQHLADNKIFYYTISIFNDNIVVASPFGEVISMTPIYEEEIHSPASSP